MVFWLYVGLFLAVPPLLWGLALAVMYLYVRWKYMGFLTRIFQEKPLFVVPRGQPIAEAEDVTFLSGNGLRLRGCYLRAAGPRRGVILFGLEFGSNRWACVQYCQHLVVGELPG